MFDWLFGKKTVELSAEVVTKLNKLQPQLLQQAQAMKQAGDTKLFDKLVEIAEQKEPPKPPGFFGNLVKSVGTAFKGSVLHSAILSAGVAGVTYAIGSSAPDWIGLDGTDAQKEALKEYTNKAGETAENVLKDNADLGTFARNRGLMFGAISLTAGTLIGATSYWKAAKTEAQQELAIWQQMNAPQQQVSHYAAAQPPVVAPQNLPHMNHGMQQPGMHV